MSYLKKKQGFTLIELLVVIAIIAMLLSILMPSLGKAKSVARRIICRNNIRQQCLGITLYAGESDSWVPTQPAGNWLWDVSFWSTNQISNYAGFDDNEVYYCPENRRKSPDDARFWQYSWVFSSEFSGSELTQKVVLHDESGLTTAQQKVLFRVMPLLYMFDKIDSSGNSILPQKWISGQDAQWISKINKLRSPTSTIMLMDNVISQDQYNFFEITAGGAPSAFGVRDTSNHKSNHRFGNAGGGQYKPSGANIGYADGHVDSRKFDDMQHRVTVGLQYWW